MKELKNAIGEFSEYNREYEELRRQNQRCSENLDLYYERKDGLVYQVQNMEQERKDLIDKVALGDADPSTLSETNERLSRLKGELAEAEELYEAVERGQESSAKEMWELINGQLKRQKEIVWAKVAEIEIEEAAKSAMPQIKREFMAFRRSGRRPDFTDFLKEAFNIVLFEERYWGDNEIALEQAIIKQHQLPFGR